VTKIRVFMWALSAWLFAFPIEGMSRDSRVSSRLTGF
jgi:hypothetical protein